jgi:hypothetical protein
MSITVSPAFARIGFKISAFDLIDALLDAYKNNPYEAVYNVFQFCGTKPLLHFLPVEKRDAYFCESEIKNLPAFQGYFYSERPFFTVTAEKIASRGVKIKTPFGEVALPTKSVEFYEDADGREFNCEVKFLQRYVRDKNESLNKEDAMDKLAVDNGLKTIGRFRYERFLKVAAKVDLEELSKYVWKFHVIALAPRLEGKEKFFGELVETRGYSLEDAMQVLNVSLEYCWNAGRVAETRMLLRFVNLRIHFVRESKPLLRFSYGDDVCCILSYLGTVNGYIDVITLNRGIEQAYVDRELLINSVLHYADGEYFNYSVVNKRLVDDRFLRELPS